MIRTTKGMGDNNVPFMVNSKYRKTKHNDLQNIFYIIKPNITQNVI